MELITNNFIPIKQNRMFHPDFVEYLKYSPMKSSFFLFQIEMWIKMVENKNKELVIGYVQI